MAKISMFVKFTAGDGKREAVVAALAKMLPHVEGEEGTERYVICTDSSNADVVWMYEQYADDAGLAAHASSPALGTLFGELGDVLGAPPELFTAMPVAGKGI